MVWMRTSAFPSFRKLYGRILLEENTELGHMVTNFNLNLIPFLKYKFTYNDTNQTIKAYTSSLVMRYKLPKGNYFVEIDYSI
jgi:hypothetical protein